MSRFVHRSKLAVPAAVAFAWHAREGALERLTPPWDAVRVVERSGGIRDRGRVSLSVPAGPLRVTWVAQHEEFDEGRSFTDTQLRGPFARWRHVHRMLPDGPTACVLEDAIEYALPGGRLGEALGGSLARSRLERVFSYRHRVTREDLACHAACPGDSEMKIVVTGSRGLIGSALVPFLTAGGHDVVRLVRDRLRAGEFLWDPDREDVDARAFAGADAVVHLAGENVAGGRWTAARKARIRDSRTRATRTLSEALARLKTPPRVLIAASAVGIYGDRGDELLTESSAAGAGFLAELGRDWEAACQPAADAGIRVVKLRLGVVLSPEGGALQKMLPAFRLGAGGRVGSGRQWLSWVALDDVLGAVHHALLTGDLDGPVNVTSPRPVTNSELTRTLGAVLRRPTLATLPAFAVRLALGSEMAEALLLSSARVAPERLLRSGYSFRQPDLEDALRHLLGRAS